MDSSSSYSLRPLDKDAKRLAYENFKRKAAYRAFSGKDNLSYKPRSPTTKELTEAPVFHPRVQYAATVPAPPKLKYERDLPNQVIDVCKEYNIPLNSIRMNPVIRTTEGVMIFEEYIARLHRALEEDTTRAPATEQKSSGDQYLAPRMPISNTRTIAEHFNGNMVPVEDVNSSTIIANMPNPIKPLLSDSRKVIMIHNLNPNKLSVDSLFTLCSAFGDTDRVKIMYNKRDTAFVQMSSISDANSLMRHLQGLEVWNKSLVLVKSKMDEIRLPYNLEDRSTVNLTKDFTLSANRRFGEKNAQHRAYICSPTKYLHCCNLPEEFQTDELKAFLDPDGEHIEAIVAVENRPFMYNVICHDISASVEVLMFYHGKEWHGKKVRISFTAFQN